MGIRGLLKTAGVTVIQRFGSALNLNVHFHALMIDGLYELRPGGPPLFHPVPAPTDDEVAAITSAVLRKVGNKLAVSMMKPETSRLPASPCWRT